MLGSEGRGGSGSEEMGEEASGAEKPMPDAESVAAAAVAAEEYEDDSEDEYTPTLAFP